MMNKGEKKIKGKHVWKGFRREEDFFAGQNVLYTPVQSLQQSLKMTTTTRNGLER